jgi:hypothetical protein
MSGGVKAGSDRAQELIKEARAALGGERLESLRSLSATGNYRRVVGDREMSGEIEFDMLLPDKFLKTEILAPIPGVEITRYDAINGDKAWMDSKQGGGGGGMVIMRRPGGDTPQGHAAQQQAIRAEFARLLLGWTLATPSSFPIEFSYVGEAEAPDGRAYALDVKGPDNFAARLFLDQKTHRPLMIAYRGRAPRMAISQMSGPAGSREEIEKRVKEAEAAMAAAPEVEMQIVFSDYRETGGVQFPHRLTRSIDGRVTEEWEMTKFKLNPAIKPDKFDKK